MPGRSALGKTTPQRPLSPTDRASLLPPVGSQDGPIIDLLHSTLNQSCKYTLNTYYPTAFPGAAQVTNFGGTGESQIRHPGAAAFGLAAAIATGHYDPGVTGVSQAAATAQAVRLATSLAQTHLANGGTWGGPQNTPPPGAGGAGWQEALWAFYAGGAAWLVWGSLSTAQQNAVLAMVRWEANRMIAQWIIPFWKTPAGVENFAGDSKSEEIAWDIAIVLLAMVMDPGNANYSQWYATVVKGAIAQNAVPADLSDYSLQLGVTPAAFCNGTNVNADGTVVNHGITHPDYMSSAASSLWPALAIAARAGAPVPATVGRHADMLYKALPTVTFATPTYATPGGTIYPWPVQPAFYYPQGDDWGPMRTADKATFDVHAHVYGWDRGLAPSAADWARVHLGRQASLQARSTTGQTYIAANEDTYGGTYGREAWVSSHLGGAMLALTSPAPAWTWNAATVPINTSSWAAAVTSQSPALWWRFNETTGTTINDSSGYGRAGTLTGAATLGVASLVPTDGTSTAITAAGAARITVASGGWLNGPYTVMCAVKKSAPDSTENMFVSRASNESAYTARSFALSIDATTGFAKASVFNNGNNATAILGSVNIADGLVHFLALTVDSATATLYVDGVSVGSATLTPFPPQMAGNTPLTALGRTATGAQSNGVTGTLDEVVYLNAALTAAQVSSFYTAFHG